MSRGLVAGSGLIVFALAAGWAGSARAQAVDTTLWVTNGPVFSIATGNGRIYLGGNFSWVGPATGSGIPFDTTSGLPLASFPKVTGTVDASVPDGAGGWFIGGDFTSVGGLPRNNLAQVNADGTVSPWDPNTQRYGRIYAMTRIGSTVYVGGGFETIAGVTRHSVAAIDAVTGLASAWDPGPNSNSTAVWSIAASGSTVYIGGFFQTMGGQPRSDLAAVDAATGLATAWNPVADQSVIALAVQGSTVYVGGDFGTLGGQPRRGLGSIDSGTGGVTAWDPNPHGRVHVIVPADSIVYAGGEFDSIGTMPRRGIAALDATTGLATSWNPGAGAMPGYGGTAAVTALAIAGSTVYAGGYFDSLGGVPRHRLAAVDAVSGAATSWSPNADDRITTLALSGSSLYAGGAFHSLGGQPRYGIAALDASTGALTTWDPNPNHQVMDVESMIVSGSLVYVGGYFGEIGGQQRWRLAALDANTGLCTSWDAGTLEGNVFAMAMSGSTLYVGGAFTSVADQRRFNLVAVDAITGAVKPFVADADFQGHVRALAVQGSTLYVGGEFTSINGAARNYLAAVDATTGAVTDWQPSVSGTVQALAASATAVYAGAYTSTIYGGFDPKAFDTSRGSVLPSWAPPVGGPLHALLLEDCSLFMTAVTNSRAVRDFVEAVDATNGTLRSWSPGEMDPESYALAIANSKLYVGGSFLQVGGTPHPYIAAVSVAPTLTAVAPPSGGDDGPVTVTLSGSFLVSCSSVKLARAGHLDIPGTGIVAAADDGSLAATFDLRGAASGPWDVVVTNSGMGSATMSNGFTVTAVAAPQLRVDVVGPDSIRANHPTAYDLVVGNPGNVDAQAVPVWITGIPTDATVAPDFTLSSPPQDTGEPDWSQVPDTLTSAGGRYLALVIPRVPPGSVTRRIYLTIPASHATFQLRAALTPPWADGTAFRTCLAGNGVIQDPACMGAQLTAISAYLTSTPGLAALNGIGEWAKIGWQCEGAGTLAAAIAAARQALDFMVQPVEQPAVAAAGCGDALRARWRDSLLVNVVSAVDPNEKVGKRGMLSSRQAIPYEIHFENDSTATAKAQRVIVSDVLPADVDLNTVSLVAINFGGTRLLPLPGLNAGSWNVDLGPERNLVVGVQAGLVPPATFTRQLVWSFTSLDRTTLQPLDPGSLNGFLPPNHVPPEGEGSVVFTVMPLPALSTGTEIQNQGAITFDYNPVQATAVWKNTVDNTPPASHVLPLSAGQDSATFTVHWGVMGAAPDLKDYTVYVKEDAGAYHVWRLNTIATADTFAGRRGHSYAFYSQARDTIGNIEAAHGSPDAQTSPLVGVGEAVAWRLGLAGAQPNPAIGVIRAWFTLASREAATLDLIDVAGRRIARREVGELGPGPHLAVLGSSPRLRPGLYFLRLAQGGRALKARVIVIR